MREPQLIGAVHILVLLILGCRSSARLVANPWPRLAVAGLLIWSNLVVTGLLLSLFSKLDHIALYLAVSVGLAVGADIVLRRGRIAPSAMGLVSDDPDESVFDRVLRYGLGGTFALAAVASAIICLSHVPSNWDSATYRFSRAFFYLAQGNLLHIDNWDPRLSIYPLNGALLYVFPALYQFPPWSMALVTYIAWLFTALAVYVAARSFGTSRTGSAVAAWSCGMSPSVLAQATSTNDELLAAVPILLGVVFAREFWLTGQRRHAVLAGLGLGLGLGTKLHWIFYSVFVGALAIVTAVRAVRHADVRSGLARRLPMLLVAAVVAASLSTPFIGANYLSIGQATIAEFNNLVLNRPFRLSLALEKIRVNTAELFLSPFPDLVPPIDREQRRAAYTAFNRFFVGCCFSDLVETVKLSHPGGYAFRGPANPDGYLFREYTWLGFLPHLFLLVGAAGAAGAFGRRFPLASVVCVLSFFCWHATTAMQTRYQDGSIYYSFAAVLAAGGLGPAWDFARRSRQTARRLFMVCFFIVFGTHLMLGYNLLQFGELRNLRFLWRGEPAPDAHPVDARVADAVRSARAIYIPYTRWEVLYWNFMRFNPTARYTTGKELVLPASRTLMLLSIAPLVDTGIDAARFPARLPSTTGPGLTYLGRADGDHVFAQGDGVESRFPERRGYVLLRFTWSRDEQSRAIKGVEAIACCVGNGPADRVEWRFELLSRTTGKQIVGEWARPGSSTLGIRSLGDARFDTLVIETRGVDHPDEVVRTVHDLTRQFYDIRAREDS